MLDILISVICPVYNSELFLKECVFSVIQQTSNNWELMLIDDGSTDSSGLLCDEFSSQDCRIKTIHKNNEGQMKARIDGILHSSGNYIIFLDSDDVLEKDAIEVLTNSIRNNESVDGFLFNAIIFPKNNNKHIPTVKDNLVLKNKSDVVWYTFGNQMFGYLWMYCFKRDILLNSSRKENNFLDVRYTEDGAFLYKTISEMRSLCTLNLILYKYRDNPISITHNLTSDDRRDRFLVFNYIYSDIFNKNTNFKVTSSLSTMISWAMFSYLEHCENKNTFKLAFKEARKSIIFKKIVLNVKITNKKFKVYKLLLKLNLLFIFYWMCKKHE